MLCQASSLRHTVAPGGRVQLWELIAAVKIAQRTQTAGHCLICVCVWATAELLVFAHELTAYLGMHLLNNNLSTAIRMRCVCVCVCWSPDRAPQIERSFACWLFFVLCCVVLRSVAEQCACKLWAINTFVHNYVIINVDIVNAYVHMYVSSSCAEREISFPSHDPRRISVQCVYFCPRGW